MKSDTECKAVGKNGTAALDPYRHIVPDGHIFWSKKEFYPLLIAEKSARRILPYSLVNNGNFTLHDAKHSERVIENVNKIIDILNTELSERNRLSEQEVLLLYISAWYHDIGMVVLPRSKEINDNNYRHGDASCAIIRRKRKEFSLKTVQTEAICTIIRSHNHGFEEVPEKIRISGKIVRLKKLCAVLSLADVCDICHERASTIVQGILEDEDLRTEIKNMSGADIADILDEESKKHWIANINSEIEIIPDRNTIYVGYLDEDTCERALSYVRKYAQGCLDG